MAQRIDPSKVVSRSAGAPSKYPWHEWTDGSCWLLHHGEDYQVTTESLRGTVYNHAKRHGLAVIVKRVDGGLTVQFSPKTEESA
jgi:hypothetical protein